MDMTPRKYSRHQLINASQYSVRNKNKNLDDWIFTQFDESVITDIEITENCICEATDQFIKTPPGPGGIPAIFLKKIKMAIGYPVM